MTGRAAISVLALVASCRPHETKQPAAGMLIVDDGELVLRTGGRELRAANLIGAVLQIGTSEVRLETVVHDSIRADVLLYHFVQLQEPGAPTEVCIPDAAGESWALPVMNEAGEIQLVCSSGAIGKCIRWGYPPRRKGMEASVVRELHLSCVRMVRADYGGDGTSWTRDGTVIAFCDRVGINPCPKDVLDIEAAWSTDGAVCIVQTRIAEIVTATKILERYPRVAAHGSSCTMATADKRALLFNWNPAQ